MSTKVEATIEDLYYIPENGKAEIIDGKVVKFMPTGFAPNYAAGEIFVSLREYARRMNLGYAMTDNVGYSVNLPHRKSFSPDASLYTGRPTGGKFLEGAPVFAVEVRSENDYGESAEKQMADKRADYFAAGTLVVWDVDVLLEELVRVYRHTAPDEPVTYRRGEIAEAEPAVPGWTLPVDNLFL